MWVWIVISVVVIGGILVFWIVNAARLADKNRSLKRRSPRLFDPAESREEQEQRVRRTETGDNQVWDQRD